MVADLIGFFFNVYFCFCFSLLTRFSHTHTHTRSNTYTQFSDDGLPFRMQNNPISWKAAYNNNHRQQSLNSISFAFGLCLSHCVWFSLFWKGKNQIEFVSTILPPKTPQRKHYKISSVRRDYLFYECGSIFDLPIARCFIYVKIRYDYTRVCAQALLRFRLECF